MVHSCPFGQEGLRIGSSLKNSRVTGQFVGAPMFFERSSANLYMHTRSAVAAAIDGETGQLSQRRWGASFEDVTCWVQNL